MNSGTSNYVSENNNMNVKIFKIFQKKLVVEYLDREFDDEITSADDLYLNVNIEVLPKEIVRVDFYGQTEIEDIRYKTELDNTGRNINPEEIYIFKEYDIKEGGIDWNFINNRGYRYFVNIFWYYYATCALLFDFSITLLLFFSLWD